MTRETKVGLVVAASFVCLVGGVFATKYLHKEGQPDATAPVAQTPPEKQPGGEEAQQNPPAPPLYTPPESKGVPPLDLPPFEPNPRKPAGPPPDLDPLPLGPVAKPNKPAPPGLDDPSKDDVFNPVSAPSNPKKPAAPPPDLDPLPLTPVPSGPAKPSKPSGPPPDLDLAPLPGKEPAKAPKMLPPDDTLVPPPAGGIKRVANQGKPDDTLPGLDLPPDDKKDEKKDGKKDKLPPPAGGPPLDLLPLPGNNPPNLPAPKSEPKLDIAPPAAAPKPEKKMDPPPALPNPKPSDVPPALTNPKPSDIPPELSDPKPPLKPTDPGIALPAKDKKTDSAATLGPKPTPEVPPEAPVSSYDEEWYYVKQGDTLESISQKFFFTPKYEQALRQYNLDRNWQASFRQERPSLSVGQVVKVPPARILEKSYPATLPGFRPTGNTKPDAAGPTTIPPTGATPSTEFIGEAREYEVKREGITFKDIAKEELRDERQWTRIFMLNRALNPSAAIPVGTRVALPRGQ